VGIMDRGQAAFEYLLLIGAGVLVSAILLVIVTSAQTTTTDVAQADTQDFSGRLKNLLSTGSTDCRYCDGIFVGTDKENSITSAMIVDGAITTSDINPSQIQLRITKDCGTQAISKIDATGNATCIPVTAGATTWTTSGNNQYSAVTGNVGINTTNPTDTLTINLTGKDNNDLSKNTTFLLNNGQNIKIRNNGPGGSARIETTAGLVIQPGTNLFIANNSNIAGYNAVIAASDTFNTYFANNGGNVGIGTSNPTSKLTVNGTLNVTNNRITGLAAPTDANDAATKDYVDAATNVGTYSACYVLYSATSGVACATGYTTMMHHYGNSGSWVVDTANGATNAYAYLITVGGDSILVSLSYCHYSHGTTSCNDYFGSESAGSLAPGTWTAAGVNPAISFADGNLVRTPNTVRASMAMTLALCCK